ncbi:MAG: EF-P lysine aminoacylase GenX [Magnetococcales bacterium]|nr:EF-P lysine aminoacylase GenX [Magnetococcales bacterium]NGZ06505.1 EF-P lysine aminoacylase GenX [Magnetococcales bacterium]
MSNAPRIDPDLWRPAARPHGLAARARTLHAIRTFFAKRQVLEVETPILSRHAAPDEAIDPLTCQGWHLSTSPETAMKRLLAAGSGPIFQITRAFRAAEYGRLHNPEFTMLEWYQPGWQLHDLMHETTQLVQEILGAMPVTTFSFAAAFRHFTGLDPFLASDSELRTALPDSSPPDLKRMEMLDLLLTETVEPGFQTTGGMVLLTHFPAERAAMAQIDPGPPPTALRFELYVHGIELVNGYQELTDAAEQACRLEHANHQRHLLGKPKLPVDPWFLAALHAGIPMCAGAALGVDRLIMLAMGATDIAETLAFPYDRA